MTDPTGIASDEDLKRQVEDLVLRAYPEATAIDVKISVRLPPAQEFVWIDIVPAATLDGNRQ